MWLSSFSLTCSILGRISLVTKSFPHFLNSFNLSQIIEIHVTQVAEGVILDLSYFPRYKYDNKSALFSQKFHKNATFINFCCILDMRENAVHQEGWRVQALRNPGNPPQGLDSLCGRCHFLPRYTGDR